ALYGHTQAVTCLAASVTYSIFVSGSSDRTCIIWDLNQLTYINQLPAHGASLCSVAINNSTGDIISCAGSYLYLWTVNGQLLANINTSCSPECCIVCCCFAEVMDWDTRSIIITGSTDGVVRLWKTEYTNIPDQAAGLRPQRDTKEEPGNTSNYGLYYILAARNSSKLLVGDDWGRICCWSVDGRDTLQVLPSLSPYMKGRVATLAEQFPERLSRGQGKAMRNMKDIMAMKALVFIPPKKPWNRQSQDVSLISTVLGLQE
ncbi:PREDICTED: WD repeat- and FYVE domain-containing protein 4-like, partial [Buceros rhinoceros silvestris]|uniref:WD repeat- and FYVE domain-containing protein 4-like n=1 Tax=Buceros rhinoceros silvestris TaxID=175836 RepID=UPI000528DA79